MASTLVKTAMVFKDDAGNTHDSALRCLIENKRIAMRGIFNQGINGIPIKNGHVTTEEAVKIIAERHAEFAKIAAKYDKAIRREREKGTNAAMTTPLGN